MVEENDIRNFTFSFSSRFLRVPSNLSEDPNLEIFIQREPSQRKSKIDEQEQEQEIVLLDLEEGGSSNVTKWKQQQKQHLHMINHRILISDAVATRSRWSDLNSSDLLSLKSEMLHDVSSARFSPDEDENSFTALNPGEKRCMSEIANVPRFVEVGSRRRNGNDETMWRIWLPIARRTVQWFVRQETNSVQLLQHKHLASNV
ncbi:hypothetical protein RYX36_013111 [Vicia faba]